MRAVFRPILSLSLLAALLCSAPALQAQTHTTNVTVSSIFSGGTPGVLMPYGNVCAYATGPQGSAVSVTESGWGLVPAGAQMCGNVVTGTISGGINVPDANHSYSAAPFNYNFVIQQTDASGNNTGLPVTIKGVPNVTGSTFALDMYAPVVSVPAVSPTVGYNSSVPTSCVSPSIWTTPSGAAYGCASGVYIAIGGGSSTLAGDVTGAAGSNTVVKIQGKAVSSTLPAAGEGLFYDGTQYVPALQVGQETRSAVAQAFKGVPASAGSTTTLFAVGGSFTATTASGSSTITSINNPAQLYPGQTITGTGIPSSTTVVSVNVGASTAVLSASATANGTAVSLTAAGAGNMLDFDLDMACGVGGSAACARDSIITITIDGTAFSSPLGLFFAEYGTEDCPSFVCPLTFSRDFIVNAASSVSSWYGWRRKEFIPFYSSATVTLTMPPQGGADLFWDVDFFPGAVPANLYPPNEKYWHMYVIPFLNNYTDTGQFITLLPSITGPGQIGKLVMATSGVTLSCALDGSVPTWLESTPIINMDGGVMRANGMEDFFGGSFYFVGGRPQLDEWGVTKLGCGDAGNNFAVTAYRTFDTLPQVFTSTADIQWQSGCCAITSVPLNFGSAVTYYTLNPQSTPAGPAASFNSSQTATLFGEWTAASLATGGNTSGSTVVSWPDASGNGHTINTVGAGTPLYESSGTINSGPTVRFDGASSLTLAGAFGGSPMGITAWAVINIPDTSSNALFGDNNNGYGQGAIRGNNIAEGFSGPHFKGPTGDIALSTGTPHVVMFTFANGIMNKICVDGNLCSYAEAGNYSYTWTSTLVLGGDYTVFANFFKGDMAEFDFYTGLQTSSQAGTTGAALCSTYGVTCASTWF